MGSAIASVPEQSPPGGGLRGLGRRRQRLLIFLGSSLALYTVFGFLILPWILHRQLEKRLTAALHRQTTIAQVRTNPYALSVTIDGLAVRAHDGGTFLSWERLYVNVGAWRILKRELALDELQLLRFHAQVSMDARGRLNFQDLLDEASASEPSEPAPPPAARKRPVVFVLQKLDIEQAQIDFKDRSRRKPFDSTIGPLDIRLQGFRTVPDSTSPYSFSGTTESGESFSWAGSVLTEPVRSSGTIAFDGLRLAKYSPYYEQEVGFEIRDGRLGVKTGYELEWGSQRHLARLSEGAISLRSLVLALPGGAQPKVELPEADVAGISVDALGRTARVGSVVLRNGVVRARRDAQGAFDVEQLKPPKKSGPPPPEKTTPLRWAVGKVELAGWRLELLDEMPSRPASFVLTPVDVRLENLSDSPQQSSPLSASIGWNGKGQVDLMGQVNVLRPAADLSITVDQLDLPPFDSYLDLYGGLAARLGAGKLAIRARGRFDGGAEPASWSFEGDTRVDGLALLDSERNQELVRWKELQVTGIRTASSPPGLSIRAVRWVQPRLRVALAEDGSSNLRRLLKRPQPPPAGPEITRTPAKSPRPDGPQPAVSVGTFQIVRGLASFVDRSVSPPVTLSMTDLDVRLRGVSNAANGRAQVSIKALVSGGPMEITGTLSPRFLNDVTDVKISSKDVDLTPLSPYCGKYAGYLLDRGKLDLDLQYKVARRQLAATNVIKVEQFTFGEATESKDATKLPVKLGLAVLQDPDGLIDLDVPIEGNVDDPDFRIGKVVWHAIGNVLLKAVTSPFTLLGKLFGGGGSEKLDVIEFQAAAANLTPGADKSLQALAKALASRPALKADIEGTTDAAADVKALKLRGLKREAEVAKAKAGGKAELTDEEYLRFLEKRYRTLVPGAPAGAPADAATMEGAALAAVELPPEALGSLKQERAEAARTKLVGLGVDPGRLFVTQGGERAKKEAGARVYFSLK